jgi:hypothetical protein
MAPKLLPIPLLVLSCLAACAHAPAAPRTAAVRPAVPRELRADDWSRTPADVLRDPRPGERLVWGGEIESLAVREVGAETELEWLCRQLAFHGPGPQAVTARPVPLEPRGAGEFVVRSRKELPPAEVARIRHDVASMHQYVVVGGIYDGTAEVEGREVVRVAPDFFDSGPDVGILVP